ncbi:MAG: MoaD/ThiS family protein [Thermoproteus sp. AZ2]|uniref:MoaD/ThiS family protein n=1 Tax=Thermoproteus sp. AZ2 TaxID=1609232 RepID=A0ACC6V2E4_9CREN|nr:MAG: molybdopterin converting factor, small subunit [Thermoproteus sp. AZ2]
MVKVKLAGVLVNLAGRNELTVEASTVRELIHALKAYPKLYARIWDPRGRLMPDIYIAVNDVDVRLLSGLDTSLKPEDVVLILAYIHGG